MIPVRSGSGLLRDPVGGGKKHGQVNYALGADIPYTIVDRSNPLMEGMSDITIFDEAFFNMTWSKNPPIHLLATTVIPGTPSAGSHQGEVVPQIWTFDHTAAGWGSGASLRVDAGPHLCQLRFSPDPNHAPQSDCVGGEKADQRIGGLQGSGGQRAVKEFSTDLRTG